jgi:hypothetical protein
MPAIRTRIALSSVLFLSACASISSMRSEEGIKASLLKLTPIGSTFDHVEMVARKEGWEYLRISRNHGYLDSCAPSGHGRIVGNASISVTIGEHFWFPLGTEGAYADWGFDEKDRLIEICVHKEINTL